MYGDFLTLIWKNLLIQFNIKLMCFYKTKESKVLVAKRDIKVYKIGVYADKGIFNPFFRSYFEYSTN